MLRIGIDPGFKGGLAALRPDGSLMDGIRMPVTSIRKREVIDTKALTRWLQTLYDHVSDVEIVIEAVHSMPKQGVASTFKFGRAAGAVEAWAMVMASGPLVFVTPKKWKGDMQVTRDKRGSLALAAELWPTPPAHIDWDILRNDGIAEAALIAEHRRTFG